MPIACKACPSTSRLPAWPAMSPPIASACWPRAPASSGSAPGSKTQGLSREAVWPLAYAAAALLVLVGLFAAVVATRAASRICEKPAQRAARSHASSRRRRAPSRTFLSRDAAIAILLFVVLFKLCDALAGTMTAPFVLSLGYTKAEYAAIVKGVGLAALLIGGFAGGAVARALPLVTALWIGAFLQMFSNLAFVWLGYQTPEPRGADRRHRRREFLRRHRHGDLRRLPVGAVPQSAAHGDAVRAAHGARLDGPHAVLIGNRICRRRSWAGRCSSSAPRSPPFRR